MMERSYRLAAGGGGESGSVAGLVGVDVLLNRPARDGRKKMREQAQSYYTSSTVMPRSISRASGF
jgi:hypothetical protein